MAHHALGILLVEDNPSDARLLREYLAEAELLEATPERAETLEAALGRLGNGASQPDVVLLDLGLPDAEGLEAVERVTDAAPALPVVVLTGRDDRQTAVEALRKGAEDYLLKGELGPDTLARSIRYALERNRAQRELEAERARLSEVFRNAPAWIATFHGPEHVFEMANPAFFELVGERQVSDRPVREVFPELEGSGYVELLDHVYETGETVEVKERELRLEAPNSERTATKHVSFVYQPRREEGEVVGVIAHGVDVTEQVKRRRQAEERKEKLDKVLETSADGILIADADGDFTYANPAAEELLGLDAPEITSRSYRDPEWGLRGPDGGPLPDEELPVARVLRTGEPVKGVEFSVEHADGGRRVLSGHHAPLKSPEGKLQGVVVSLRDVTEVRQTQRALEHARDLFQGIFDISPVALKVVDAETQEYRTVNDVFTEQFGYTREEVEAGRVRDRDLWPDPKLRRQVYGRVTEGETVRNVEVRLRRRDGSVFDALFSASSLVVEGRRFVVGAIQDISYQKEVERELQKRALHDELTGLPNRALLDDRLEHALERCDRTDESLAVCFVDLKRFKLINDSLGHEAGDRVLEQVADRLNEVVREQDTVARVGGDEFAVLLEDVDGEADVLAASDRILGAFEDPIPLGGREVPVEASVGVAIHEGREAERPAPTDLLRWADEAMYRAKGRPGTAHALADPDRPAPDTTAIEREQRFRAALEEERLATVYQPIVGVRDGTVRGVEALCRWSDPELGEVPPGTFIPIAEETGLIVELGEQQLEASCRSLLSEEGLAGLRERPPLRLHVNLSARQLQDPEVVERVDGVLGRTGFPPGRLCLEVTESAAARDPEVVDRLGELGVEIALDDFGTRYSTLGQLKRLRVDRLKIDHSFVAGLAEDDRDWAIVESVLTLGHALGLGVVAEGVETEDQMGILREMGGDEAQGFHLARPMALGELREWLDEER